MLAQLRTGAKLPTFLNFADIWAGFDTVPVDDICSGVFAAGIVGRAWLLLDEILHQDRSRTAFADLHSDWLSFQNGIAQGRKSSVHMYNRAAVALRDIVLDAAASVSVPTDMCSSRFLARVSHVVPCSYRCHSPTMTSLAADEIRTGKLALRDVATCVSTLEHHADRLVAAESACPVHAYLFQQVDHLLGPASSALQSFLFWQACESTRTAMAQGSI